MEKRYKLFVFILMTTVGFSQISTFQGGRLRIDHKFKLHNLMPEGGFNLGTSAGFLSQSPEYVFMNPAGLSFLKTAKINTNITPPAINPFNFISDLQSEIDNAFEEGLKDEWPDENKASGVAPDTYNYPLFNQNGTQTLSLNSMTVAIPMNKFTVGVGYYNYMDLDLGLIWSGMRLKMQNRDIENPTNDLDFVLQNDMSLRVQANIIEQAFGLSYRINDDFNVGASVVNTTISAVVNADILFDGYILKQGVTIPFNTKDTESFTNNLSQSLKGEMYSNSQQYIMSSNFRLNDHVAFSAIFKTSNELEIKGDLLLDANYPNFIQDSESEEEDEGGININNNYIDSSNPTRTQRVINHAKDFKFFKSGLFSTSATFTSSSGSLQLALQADFHNGANGLEYTTIETRSWTKDDYTKRYDIIKTDTVRNKKMKFEPKIGGRLGFRWGWFHLGTGVTIADLVMTKDGEDEITTIPLPYFMMSFGGYTGEKTKVNLMLGTLSLPFGRFSVSYEL